MEDFGAHANRIAHGGRRDRHDHEFLNVDRIVGMHAAIDDVHHRHRQHAGIDAADIAIERQFEMRCGGFGDRKADAQNRIGAEPAFVRGAVQRDHRGSRFRFGLRRRGPRSHRRSRRSPLRPPAARPCRRSAWDRRRASPALRGRRSKRRDGTAARPSAPNSRRTSTSTVGLPRESRISRARISIIAVINLSRQKARQQIAGQAAFTQGKGLRNGLRQPAAIWRSGRIAGAQ